MLTMGMSLEPNNDFGFTSQMERRWVHLDTTQRPHKESNPIEVAEYAIVNKIVHEHAFAWWVPKFIKRRDRNISKLKTRKFIQRSHKFGIQVPQTIKRALEMDKETGTTFWFDTINKEMKNNKSAFDILESFKNGGKVPPGYSKITSHMIFDI